VTSVRSAFLRSRERLLDSLGSAGSFGAGAHYCPCCGSYPVRFLDWNRRYRGVVCPLCLCHPRHRALCLHLEERPGFFEEAQKVLHVAPSLALRRKLASLPNLDNVTADLADPSVDVRVDVTDIPYDDGTFDVILCAHVLEHVADDSTAIRELFRVLRPGGWAFLAVPIDDRLRKTLEGPAHLSPEERRKLYWQEDHIRLYGLDYGERLRQAGFVVEAEDWHDRLTPEELREFGLQYSEILHFGAKPG